VSEIQSLARGLIIMDLIANAENGMSITELAGFLDIDKSSASRLVRTLVNHEYVQPKTGSRCYILGKRLYRMSWQLLNRMPVREKAKPFLYRLVQTTGECAHTAVYSEGKTLVIDDVEAEASLRVAGRTGRLIPLHSTAIGKALLAFSNVPMPETLVAETARTLTDPAYLVEHLAAIREQGYALDDEEHEEHVRCIAAPVYDYTGIAIATIGISGPTVRVTDERIPTLARQVMDAARRLSAELGYVDPELAGRSPNGKRSKARQADRAGVE
jgi:IclR family KDG regulon transcriptional repressor